MVYESDDPTSVFELERPRLFALAYRMLGSAAEADDVTQETWLRWQAVDRDVDNPAALLTTITSRLAIDRLKSAQYQREQYVGPWLPEPITTSPGDDPETATLMAESIMIGFLAVLERLGPVERAVFLLHEVFGLPYAEVALIVNRSEVNCRQIGRRAREHVRADRSRVAPDTSRDRKLLDAFLMALVSGEPDQLAQVLHEDVVLVSDGGPDVRAARKPILGATRVAKFISSIAKNAPTGEITLDYLEVNEQLSVLVKVDGREASLYTLEPAQSGDQIGRIFIIRNPEKLDRINKAEPIDRLSSPRITGS